MNKKTIEKIIEIPAVSLEETIKTSEFLVKSFNSQKPVKKVKRFWHMLGPGLTTGAADDDPSGIATYSQTGSKYGFNLLWLAPLTFPLMAIIQEMCARIGLATGRGLASNISRHFPKKILYLCTALLLIANIVNIGADLGAMAKSSQLLFPTLNFTGLVVFFALISLVLQIFLTYGQYAKYLKWLTLTLFSYVFSMFLINIDIHQLLRHTFMPVLNFTKDQIFLVCAVLGTTISPYLFFWQTSQEVEEEILEGRISIKQRQFANKKEIKKMRIDIWMGMFFSNLVMFCIIATCGTVLFSNGITNIQTAAEAASALRPLAGEYAYLLFASGIIGVGMLAVPVLAGSASYALSEALGYKEGLYRKLNQARAFYGIIIISMLIGIMFNFTNLDPIKMLIYAAVINGLVAPIILVLIMKISSDKKIMGQWANRPAISGLGWLATILMILVGSATVASIMFKVF